MSPTMTVAKLKCTKCNEAKPPEAFHRNSDAPSGRCYWCKTCSSAKQAEWRRRNKARIRETNRRYLEQNRERKSAYDRVWQLKRRYGMTPDQYDSLLAAQGGVCAICKHPDRAGRKKGDPLHVDHDHATGVIRGLLCVRCNFAIGALDDSPEILDRAIAYLSAGRQPCPQ